MNHIAKAVNFPKADKHLKDVIDGLMAIINHNKKAFDEARAKFIKAVEENPDIADVIKWQYESVSLHQYRHEEGARFFLRPEMNLYEKPVSEVCTYIRKIMEKLQNEINHVAREPMTTTCIIWTRNERLKVKARAEMMELIEGFQFNVKDTVEFIRYKHGVENVAVATELPQ